MVIYEVDFLKTELDDLATLRASEGVAVMTLVVDQHEFAFWHESACKRNIFCCRTCGVCSIRYSLIEEIVDYWLFTFVPG